MIMVGFVAKTGSAVAVALTLDPRPKLVERRTLMLAPDTERFVFHAAQALGDGAARFVRDATKKIDRATRATVTEFLSDTGPVGGAAIVGSTLEMPGPVDEIVKTHTRLHTAEGVLYRAALADALAVNGVPTTLVGAGELDGYGWVLTALGRVSSPWRKEHKDAAMAAAALLSARGGARGRGLRTAPATRSRRRA